MPRFDSDNISVWFNDDTERIGISIRGTKMNKKDLMSDLRIIGGNKSGHEAEITREIKNIMHINDGWDKYDGWKYEVFGHSLGANQAMNIVENRKDDDDKIAGVYLFNPGLTPTHALDTLKEATNDERFHFFLNAGDLISNTAISVRSKDSASEVFYNEPGMSPLSNHSLDQWAEV